MLNTLVPPARSSCYFSFFHYSNFFYYTVNVTIYVLQLCIVLKKSVNLSRLIESTGKQYEMRIDLIKDNNRNKMLCHCKIQDKANLTYIYVHV